MEPNNVIPFARSGEDEFNGYRAISAPMNRPEFLARVNRAIEIIYNTAGLPEERRLHHLVQAMGTADFPLLTGAVIERELLAGFGEYPQPLNPLFLQATRTNLNMKELLSIDGGDSELTEIPEHGPYPERKLTEAKVSYALKVYGARIGLSMQMIINDDLDAFSRITQSLGRGARYTRAKHQTQMLFTTTGWLTSLVGTTGAQASISNLPLNAANLATALSEFGRYTKNGNPIVNVPKYLVHGPALAQTAVELLTSQNLAVIATKMPTDAVSVARYATTNEYIRRFGLVPIEDKWIPSVVTSGTVAATCWGLVSDPGFQAIGEWGVLRGIPGPQVFMKLPDQVPVSGGADPWGLSFDRDQRMYKVRDVHGGLVHNNYGLWVSNGQ